jgi:hypothetical protein
VKIRAIASQIMPVPISPPALRGFRGARNAKRTHLAVRSAGKNKDDRPGGAQ